EVHAFHGSRVHSGFEDAVTALSIPLRSVHGGIGISEEPVGHGPGLVGESDADTGADGDLPPRKWQRADESIKDALRHPPCLVGSIELVKKNGELITAEPSDGVESSETALESACDRY